MECLLKFVIFFSTPSEIRWDRFDVMCDANDANDVNDANGANGANDANDVGPPYVLNFD